MWRREETVVPSLWKWKIWNGRRYTVRVVVSRVDRQMPLTDVRDGVLSLHYQIQQEINAFERGILEGTKPQ